MARIEGQTTPVRLGRDSATTRKAYALSHSHVTPDGASLWDGRIERPALGR